ncbi:protein ykgJ [Pectobacterium carotovorum subsp. carotovorum PCCS1]|nr:protein ykgJ [Pectobacterium carotovorum subsp. carotovorum PCCS1]
MSFYWAEADDGGGVVPSSLTESVSPFLRCMVGTNSKTPRCEALEGTIGDTVSCSIYVNRPSSCREFMQSGENGQTNDACNRAREKYGLPPLVTLSSPSFITEGKNSIASLTGCHSTD